MVNAWTKTVFAATWAASRTPTERSRGGYWRVNHGQQNTTYKADIKVLLKRAILDPQGRAVEKALRRLGTANVADVRIGKHIELTLTGERAEVEAQLARLIEQVLSNPVLEEATYTLTEAHGPKSAV